MTDRGAGRERALAGGWGWIGPAARPAGPVAADPPPVPGRPDPSAPAASSRAWGGEHPDKLILLFLAIPFLLQRFGLPGGGETMVPLILVAAYPLLGLLLLRGQLAFDPLRCALFAGLTGVLLILQVLFAQPGVSFSSFALLLAMYFPYALVLVRPGQFLPILRIFNRVMLVLALAGIVQFAAQFVIGPYAFIIDQLVPPAYLIPGFNVIIPLTFGAEFAKSNGVIFMEPSIYSQYLALAILIELRFFQNFRRLACYGVALMLSFSGTGLVLLVAMLPVVAGRAVRTRLAVLAVVAIIPALLAQDVYLPYLLRRIAEFQSVDSSGYHRFIAPLRMLDDFLLRDIPTLLTGLGAGSYERSYAKTLFVAHDPSWAKLLFEYGLVGAVAFAVFLATCFYRHSADRVLASAMLVIFVLLGGYLLTPFFHILFAVMLVWHATPPVTTPRPSSAAS